MNTLVKKTKEAFKLTFKQDPTHFFQAPGRVNLIGEHTDYNDGFVLPCAINFQTIVAVSIREDNQFHVLAVDYDQQLDKFVLGGQYQPHPQYAWANYVRGVMQCFHQQGFIMQGLNIAISGNIPQGAGLSSSAALELAIAKAVNSIFSLNMSSIELALLGQQAENQFVGCQCGIMDQMISALANKNQALLIDCQDLNTQAVRLPDSLSILVINSNQQRGLVDSEYNSRRQQCERAARFFGVESLREVTLETFETQSQHLDPTVARRARHVITENDRTLKMAQALLQNDIYNISELMALSHQSMRDDFEITTPEIDYLIDIVKQIVGEQGGVRMTGGGFGGCVVALVQEKHIQRIQMIIAEKYRPKTGLDATVYICQAASGANQIDMEQNLFHGQYL